MKIRNYIYNACSINHVNNKDNQVNLCDYENCISMCKQLSSYKSSINTTSRSLPVTNKTRLVLYADIVKHRTSRSILYKDYHLYNTKISHNKFEHTAAGTYIKEANSSEITTNDKNLSSKEMSHCPGHYTLMGLGLNKINDWIKVLKHGVNSNKLITSYSYLQTHNRFSILESMCECNDIMQCHNCALTTEDTTLQSTVSTIIIIE